jgi:hypothetical protein
MKSLILIPLLVLSFACGNKKSSGEGQLPQVERNPYTGEVELLRAILPHVEIFVNEDRRTIFVLEDRADHQNADRFFSCSAELRGNTLLRYDLVSGGRTLMLYGQRGTETYERLQPGTSVYGQWVKREQYAGMRMNTTLNIHSQRGLQMVVECRRF